MCGRYFCYDETAFEVEKEIDLLTGLMFMKSGDVTPGMSPAVLSANKEGAEGIKASSMFWGITGRDKKLVINARAESAADKQMFADNFEHRRCIMPAAGFYEWDKDRNKVTFTRSDKSPIYLAGVYSLSDNRDSFVILTTAANDSMIRVHDRMPLMIEKGQVRDWLMDTSAARDMLKMEMPLLDSRQDYEQLSLF